MFSTVRAFAGDSTITRLRGLPPPFRPFPGSEGAVSRRATRREVAPLAPRAGRRVVAVATIASILAALSSVQHGTQRPVPLSSGGRPSGGTCVRPRTGSLTSHAEPLANLHEV